MKINWNFSYRQICTIKIFAMKMAHIIFNVNSHLLVISIHPHESFHFPITIVYWIIAVTRYTTRCQKRFRSSNRFNKIFPSSLMTTPNYNSILIIFELYFVIPLMSHILHLANDFWQSLVLHIQVAVAHLHWERNQHDLTARDNLRFGSKLTIFVHSKVYAPKRPPSVCITSTNSASDGLKRFELPPLYNGNAGSKPIK